MRALWVAIFAVYAAGALGAPRSLEDKRIAVLEFMEAAGARLQAPETLTDECRGVVAQLVRPVGALVLTRENMLEVIKATGGRCAEGECEVETARNLKVAYFLTGQVSRVDDSLVITLNVYDTGSGALLAQQRVQAPTEVELLDPIVAATRALLTDAFGAALLPGGDTDVFVEETFGEAAIPILIGPPLVLVRFESDPPGASVRLDGAPLCTTPCARRIEDTPRRVSMELARHDAWSAPLNPGRTPRIVGSLAPRFAVLDVSSAVDEVSARITGLGPVKIPNERIEVDPGRVAVTVDDRCYRAPDVEVVVRAGDRRPVRLDVVARTASILVEATDDTGKVGDARVLMDADTDVGAAGQWLTVPLCAKGLRVTGPFGLVRELETNTLVEGTGTRLGASFAGELLAKKRAEADARAAAEAEATFKAVKPYLAAFVPSLVGALVVGGVAASGYPLKLSPRTVTIPAELVLATTAVVALTPVAQDVAFGVPPGRTVASLILSPILAPLLPLYATSSAFKQPVLLGYATYLYAGTGGAALCQTLDQQTIAPGLSARGACTAAALLGTYLLVEPLMVAAVSGGVDFE